MNIERFNMPQRRACAGFTLVEAVVASGVIGIILVALYSGLAYGVSTIRMSRENLRATQILAEKMDTFRLYSWTQLNDGNFIPKSFTNSYAPATTNSQGAIYIGTVTIDTLDKNLESALFQNVNYKDDIRKATIQVTWQTGNITRTRTISTYLARYGLHNNVY